MPGDLVVVFVGALLVCVLGAIVLVWRCYRRVSAHEALVVNTPKGAHVLRRGGLVFPIIHHAETVDLSAKTLRFERRKDDCVLTKDARVELDLVVTVRVNETIEDILRVATRLGGARSYDTVVVYGLFEARFTSALENVVRKHTLDEILAKRAEIEDAIAEQLGADLGGFVVDSVAVERLEAAPPEYAFR